MACSHVRTSGAMNFLCVPLIAQGETLGVLYVEDEISLGAASPQAVAFSPTTLQRLTIAVAERVALGLANLKLRVTLRNQSIRDVLTRLYNRRYLQESFKRVI